MEDEELWTMTAVELRDLIRRADRIATIKENQPDFAVSLPEDVRYAIGEILAEEDPKALARLARTSRSEHGVQQRVIDRLRRNARDRAPRFAEAFDLLKPLVFTPPWELNIGPALNLLRTTEPEKYQRLVDKGISVEKLSRVHELLELKAPMGCRLVLRVPGAEPTVRERIYGKTLRQVFDMFAVYVEYPFYRYYELECLEM